MKTNFKNFSANLSAHITGDKAALDHLRSEVVGESIQLHKGYSPLLVDREIEVFFNSSRDTVKSAFLTIGAMGLLIAVAGTVVNNNTVLMLGAAVLALPTWALYKLPKKFLLR